MARTAVIAGTATAVSNRVSRRQAARWSQDDQSSYAEPQYAQQPQYAQPQYAQPQYAPPPPPPAPSQDEMFEQLRQLAELKEQGILTEAEFTAQKRRILGT
jgi:hypothetical protein